MFNILKRSITYIPKSTTNFSFISKYNKHTLVLVRHGESIWNKENKFTGWHDVDLTEKGNNEAMNGGMLLKEANYEFDVAYTSVLKRAIRTLWHVLDKTDQMWIPVIRAWQLNERHYGGLTGLNKQETLDKHGKEQVMEWRRSYDIPPPALDKNNPYWPGHDRRYNMINEDDLPLTESLSITLERVLPYWENVIVPDIKAGKKVLIAAHGNSLRALVKHLDNISEDKITGLNIPTGVPLVYELDDDMKPIPSDEGIAPLTGKYLGDRDDIIARIEGVAAQTK